MEGYNSWKPAFKIVVPPTPPRHNYLFIFCSHAWYEWGSQWVGWDIIVWGCFDFIRSCHCFNSFAKSIYVYIFLIVLLSHLQLFAFQIFFLRQIQRRRLLFQIMGIIRPFNFSCRIITAVSMWLSFQSKGSYWPTFFTLQITKPTVALWSVLVGSKTNYTWHRVCDLLPENRRVSANFWWVTCRTAAGSCESCQWVSEACRMCNV